MVALGRHWGLPLQTSIDLANGAVSGRGFSDGSGARGTIRGQVGYDTENAESLGAFCSLRSVASWRLWFWAFHIWFRQDGCRKRATFSVEPHLPLCESGIADRREARGICLGFRQNQAEELGWQRIAIRKHAQDGEQIRTSLDFVNDNQALQILKIRTQRDRVPAVFQPDDVSFTSGASQALTLTRNLSISVQQRPKPSPEA